MVAPAAAETVGAGVGGAEEGEEVGGEARAAALAPIAKGGTAGVVGADRLLRLGPLLVAPGTWWLQFLETAVSSCEVFLLPW